MSTKGFASLNTTMLDATCHLTWGAPSVATWRRLCEDSLARSKARRKRKRKRA